MTLQDKLNAGHFAITAEVTPPVSASRDELLDKALPLKGLADAVNVTDGAGACGTPAFTTDDSVPTFRIGTPP